MKLLMIYVTKFNYVPTIKTLENFEDHTTEQTFENAIVAFIHSEVEDEEKGAEKIEKNLVKNIKWGAGKNNTKNVVLHSFAHLSESKASPEFTKQVFDLAEKRLQNAEFITAQTPFGYFLDLNIQAPGFSQARMFKSL